MGCKTHHTRHAQTTTHNPHTHLLVVADPTCIQHKAAALPMRVSPYPAKNLSILERSLCSTGRTAEHNGRESWAASRPLPQCSCSCRPSCLLMHASCMYDTCESTRDASFHIKFEGNPTFVSWMIRIIRYANVCSSTGYLLSLLCIQVQTQTGSRDAVDPSVSPPSITSIHPIPHGYSAEITGDWRLDRTFVRVPLLFFCFVFLFNFKCSAPWMKCYTPFQHLRSREGGDTQSRDMLRAPHSTRAIYCCTAYCTCSAEFVLRTDQGTVSLLSSKNSADMAEKFALTWSVVVVSAATTAGVSLLLLLSLVAVSFALDATARRRRRSRGEEEEGRSGIYAGRVWHVRFKPTVHRFSYPIFYCLVDLDELDVAFPW